jgi:hypothetical protein
LSKHANLSVNFGYIVNSNPKGLGDFVLLDRPDEFLVGLGFDFPVNKFFQPVAEVRSTQYVGGRTPNAFENNPVEVIGGVKIYPRRWFGFGAAYRRHLNSQDSAHFNDASATVNVVQVTGATATVTPTTGGAPTGFNFSDDPNGFIGQFWIGRRNARALPPPPNAAPTVNSVTASTSSIMLPCPEGRTSETCTPSPSREVQITVQATDPDNDTLLYTWSVTGGRISGEGRQVTWDLSGVNPGSYTATVSVNDGNNHTADGSTTVTVGVCACPPPPCPTISVSCPSEVDQGTPITFSASVVGGGTGTATYNWSVSAGTITSGQGTPTITVATEGTGGSTVTATVEVGGLDPACARTASCSTSVKPPIVPARKFDEYGNIRFNDEKARLDNFAIQLQNEPNSQGYYIIYGTCAGEGQARADRAKDYLVNNRGIDASRIVIVDGGCRADFSVQLWIVPSGAEAPAASMDGAIDPCPECRRRPRRRRR